MTIDRHLRRRHRELQLVPLKPPTLTAACTRARNDGSRDDFEIDSVLQPIAFGAAVISVDANCRKCQRGTVTVLGVCVCVRVVENATGISSRRTERLRNIYSGILTTSINRSIQIKQDEFVRRRWSLGTLRVTSEVDGADVVG